MQSSSQFSSQEVAASHLGNNDLWILISYQMQYFQLYCYQWNKECVFFLFFYAMYISRSQLQSLDWQDCSYTIVRLLSHQSILLSTSGFIRTARLGTLVRVVLKISIILCNNGTRVAKGHNVPMRKYEFHGRRKCVMER